MKKNTCKAKTFSWDRKDTLIFLASFFMTLFVTRLIEAVIVQRRTQYGK